MSNEPGASRLTTMLVGQHYNPPATVILKCLRNGTTVRLVPEPTNPFGDDAIEVRLVPRQIDLDRLHSYEVDLVGHGSSAEEVEAEDDNSIRLGHVAASGGKPLARATARHPGLVGTKELAAVVPCEGRLEWVGEDVLIRVEPIHVFSSAENDEADPWGNS